ncbi:MAG: hypothetical protein H6837_15200 [Planctomycetes bacterium]|nr:hypothetical protein [Planctomycetota bacterium]
MYKQAPLPIGCRMRIARPGRGAARRYIAVQVPVEHKDLAESIQDLVDATVKAASGNAGGGAVDYAATEALIAEQTAAIERAAHKEVLRSLDVDASRIRVRGEQFAKIGRAQAMPLASPSSRRGPL